MTPTKEQLSLWTLNQLKRRRDQHWEMAGLARHDGDTKDATRHTELAKAYGREIAERLLMKDHL